MDERSLRPHPIQIVEGGLEGIVKGLEMLKIGVSGKKLVLRLSWWLFCKNEQRGPSTTNLRLPFRVFLADKTDLAGEHVKFRQTLRPLATVSSSPRALGRSTETNPFTQVFLLARTSFRICKVRRVGYIRDEFVGDIVQTAAEYQLRGFMTRSLITSINTYCLYLSARFTAWCNNEDVYLVLLTPQFLYVLQSLELHLDLVKRLIVFIDCISKVALY